MKLIFGVNAVASYVYRIGAFYGGHWIDSTAPIGSFASTRRKEAPLETGGSWTGSGSSTDFVVANPGLDR